MEERILPTLSSQRVALGLIAILATNISEKKPILEASAGVKSKIERSLLSQREGQHIEGGDEADERLTLMVYSQPPTKTQ